MQFEAIGVIHSPYKTMKETPIQPHFSKAVGRVEIFKEYEEGLKDIEDFSHIILVYLFHKSKGFSLLVKPFLDKNLKGLFATRSPCRPNPIGLSVVKLLERRENILEVEGIDTIDKTPLLDIKPYVPEFDQRERARIGWLKNKLR